MDETFFLSNIVPQDFENNSGFWYRMEAYSRGLTKRYTNVHVVSGPLYLPTEDEMGRKFVHYEVNQSLPVLLESLRSDLKKIVILVT